MNRLLDNILLHEITRSARTASLYIQGMTREEFHRDERTRDAVIRRLEVMGEAAGRVSVETQRLLPGIPWNDMVKLRHDLIHRYDTVHPDTLWETVQNSPALLAAAEPFLADTPL